MQKTEHFTTLVVDDDDFLLKSLPSFISRVPGVEVVGTARDGCEALSKLKVSQPKIVLMDVRMPRMDGIEATKIMLKLYPDVRIVLMSGMDEPAMRAECMECGAHDFLAKMDVNHQFPRVIDRLFGSGVHA